MKNYKTQESAGDISWAIQVIEYKMQVGKIALARSSSYYCGLCEIKVCSDKSPCNCSQVVFISSQLFKHCTGNEYDSY